MNIRAVRLLCLSFLFVISCSYSAISAVLDSGFGNDGRVAVELGVLGDRANAVIVQPDAKIIVAGSSSGSSDLDFMLFRLLPDGSLDTAFNYDGTVISAVGVADDEVLALALQDDGKIIAAGYSSNGTDRDFALVRYNSDGSLDRNFGLEGMVVTSVGNSDDEITGVALAADGSILVTGSATGTAGRIIVLGQYTSDGTLDTGFADNGFSFTGIGDEVQAEGIAVRDDQQIIVSGTYSDGDRTGLMLVGYGADGQLDEAFADQGIAVPADQETSSEGYGLTILEDGAILVAGSVGEEGKRAAALFRFTSSGEPDTTFEEQGVLATEIGAGDDVLYDVVQAGDIIAATGYTTVGDGREFLFMTCEQVTTNVEETTESVTGSTSWLQVSALQLEDSYADYQADDDLVVDVVTTEFSQGTDMATALDAASATDMVAVGISGLDSDSTSAAVIKYTTAASVETSSSSAEEGNQYIFTGEPYDVTRTTAVIPVEVYSGIGTVTQRGVVFSTTPNPVLKDNSGGDSSSPTITSTNSGTVFSQGETVSLELSTDEDATCRYSQEDQEYSSMVDECTGAGTTSHSADLGELSAAEYLYYVRCEDTEGNANGSSTEIYLTVSDGETTGPEITSTNSGADFSEDDSVTLEVTTAEDATCRYSQEDQEYSSMAYEFTGAGTTSHSADLGNLSAADYLFYVRCEDADGTANSSSTQIIVTVSADGCEAYEERVRS